jgi:hypothetical protein
MHLKEKNKLIRIRIFKGKRNLYYQVRTKIIRLSRVESMTYKLFF